MLSRFFCWVAAIDPQILRRCPATDKMWATQLGASLLVSLSIVFIITLHSTGYVPVLESNMPLRFVVAALIAFTIFLFDRALYQSDWFRHGYFHHDNPAPGRNRMALREKWVRVGGRLAISFCVAYSLSIFLELAIFSGSIIDRLEQEHRRMNAPHLAKMELFRKDQEAQLADRRAAIGLLQKELMAIRQVRDESLAPGDPRLHDIAQQQERLVLRERQLAANIRTKETEVAERQLEVICENEGTKPDRRNPDRCSGLASCGPRCRTALQLLKVHQGELQVLQAQIEATGADARRLSLTKDKLMVEAKETSDRRRAELEHRRRDLDIEIDRKQAALAAFEAAMPVRVRAYDHEIKRSPGYVEFRADPLMRLRALQMLKADPHYGTVFTGYSWALKLFIMFLEVVPVLGKIFFAPPSAYAIHVQKRVEWHQNLNLDADDAEGPAGHGDRLDGCQPTASGANAHQAEHARRHLTVAQ